MVGVLVVTASASARLLAVVEGTYTFIQTDPVSGPDEYVHTHRFSSDRIKQGEPLEFIGRIDHTNRLWCFSSDVYDIQQTELNFRTAYSPRGYPHDVGGVQVRIYVTFRNRAWVSRENDPRCVQHHELTGTITGSETRQFEPGCYVLETYWEYGPSPKPRGTNQQESGTLPQFCVDRDPNAPSPPAPPPPGPGSSPPAPPPPPSSPPVTPGASGSADLGFTCGRTKFAWYTNAKQPTFVKKGEVACIVLLSNRSTRGLLELAIANRRALATEFARVYSDALMLSAAEFGVKYGALTGFRKFLAAVVPQSARALSRVNAIFTAGKIIGYAAVPIFVKIVHSQYTSKRACAAFIADVDNRRLRADWRLVFNPAFISDSRLTYASVWELRKKRLRPDEVIRRYSNLRCDGNGMVARGRGDALFTGPTTHLASSPTVP